MSEAAGRSMWSIIDLNDQALVSSVRLTFSLKEVAPERAGVSISQAFSISVLFFVGFGGALSLFRRT